MRILLVMAEVLTKICDLFCTTKNSGEYASVEEAVQQVAKSVQSEGLTLTPIFHECGML